MEARRRSSGCVIQSDRRGLREVRESGCLWRGSRRGRHVLRPSSPLSSPLHSLISSSSPLLLTSLFVPLDFLLRLLHLHLLHQSLSFAALLSAVAHKTNTTFHSVSSSTVSRFFCVPLGEGTGWNVKTAIDTWCLYINIYFSPSV